MERRVPRFPIELEVDVKGLSALIEARLMSDSDTTEVPQRLATSPNSRHNSSFARKRGKSTSVLKLTIRRVR